MQGELGNTVHGWVAASALSVLYRKESGGVLGLILATELSLAQSEPVLMQYYAAKLESMSSVM